MDGEPRIAETLQLETGFSHGFGWVRSNNGAFRWRERLPFRE
jgi:hypothetical protein